MTEKMASDRELLVTIDALTTQRGYCPTTREVMAPLGYNSTSTMNMRLVALRTEGLVDWVDGSMRTLHLTASGHKVLAAEP